MWISPETWRRVLPLNKILFAAVVLFSVTAVQMVSGSEDVLFLEEGPVMSKGLPYIYPNALTVYTGYYRCCGGKVSVMFTDEVFAVPGTWKPGKCGEFRGLFFKTGPEDPEGSADIFFYSAEDPGGRYSWSLFFRFPGNPDCGFAGRFLKRFTYLQKDWKSGLPPLMPAVIE